MDLLIHEKASFHRWAEESEPFTFFSFDPSRYMGFLSTSVDYNLYFLKWNFTVMEMNA